MKINQKILITLLLSLIWTSLHAGPYLHNVWRIGEKDDSPREFALFTGNSYTKFLDCFPNATAIYDIEHNTAADIPYILPGPSDSWAGNNEGTLLIRFGADKSIASAAARLRIYLAEAQASLPPKLDISVGKFRYIAQAPAGDNIHYPDDKSTKISGLLIEIDFPIGTFSEGENVLSIRNMSGSWAVLDAIELKSEKEVGLVHLKDSFHITDCSSLPALIYGNSHGELLQPLKINIVNWGKSLNIKWFYNGIVGGTAELSTGFNTIDTAVPEKYSGKSLTIDILPERGERLTAKVDIAQVDKNTIYLIQHTHTDIGYTKPQTEILAEHMRYIDNAIEYCELTSSYPDDAKFRWTCEASWPVREWLRVRPKEQVDKFIKFVHNGQIELTAMFFNMSELSGENSYKTFLEPVARFRELGLPVNTAMQNDVNGVAWCLADYLPDLGIKYFSIGSNDHRALIPFDRPTLYRWESPSGKSLLMFRSDHYHTGNMMGIHSGDINSFGKNLFDYISKIQRRGYPFPIMAVQYSGYRTDNSPPSMHECDLIRDWNELYAWPKLRSASTNEFLSQIDKEYGDNLPIYRAAYPDWWTDGFGSAARETSVSRKTQSDLITIEGMMSMASLSGDNDVHSFHDELRRIHENLLFYDEHTFGASESISNPECENSQIQWAEKGSYAWEALKSTQMMYESAIGRLQGQLYRSSHPTLTFFNALGWTRSELVTVYIDYELIPNGRAFRIVDQDGNILKTQPVRSRSEGRYYAIWAENIPPMGYKTFEIVLDEGQQSRIKSTPLIGPATIENNYYRITFDTKEGSILSLYDKEMKMELVDPNAEWKLGSFIYESLNGNRRQMEQKRFDDYHRSTLTNVQVRDVTFGGIYQSISFTGQAEGCAEKPGITFEVHLYNNQKRIELCYDFVRNPERNPSGIYVAMPWQLPEGELTFDVPGGIVYSGKNQIPRTSSSWNTVQNFVSARSDKGQIVVSGDAVPLYLLGKLLDDPYRQPRIYDKPHIFPWLMNNYWTTNFRASQEGEFKCSFSITSTKDTSNIMASRFGWSNRIPLYPRVMPASIKGNTYAQERSFLHCKNDNVLITSVEPLDSGGILVNLREIEGQEATVVIENDEGTQIRFSHADATGHVLSDHVIQEMALSPFENCFIVIEK